MPTTRTLILLIAGLVAALVAGSAYAFTVPGEGDEHASSHAAPNSQEPEGFDGTQDADDDEDDAAETAGDAEGAGPDHAALIADEFGVSADDVAALHEQGIGWGALFKLYAFADATDTDVDELIAGAAVSADGEHGFAFGEMKKSLTDDELAALEDGPKNFGQLVSGSKSKKPKDAGAP